MDYTMMTNDAFRMSTSSLTSLATCKVYEQVQRSGTFIARDLIQAARDGQIDQVHEQLHFIGREKKKLNMKDSDQTTALHYAVRYGHLKIVKLLIINGANVNVAGEGGATPLHYAARYVAKCPKRGSVSVLPSPQMKRTKVSSTTNLRDAFSKVMSKRMSLPSLVDMVMKKSSKQVVNVTGGEGIPMTTLTGSENAHAASSSLATQNKKTPHRSNYELSRILKECPEEGEKTDAVSVISSGVVEGKGGERSKSSPNLGRTLNQSSAKHEGHKTAFKHSVSLEERRIKKSKSSFELSTLSIKEDEEEEAPITLFQMGRTWKEHRLTQHGGLEYRYDEDKTSPQSNRGVVISTSSYEDHDADVQSVDALILSVVRQEIKPDPKAQVADGKRVRSGTYGSDAFFYDLTKDAELCSRSKELSDDDSVFTSIATHPLRTSRKPSFNSYQSNTATTSNGFLSPPLGINNLSFTNSDENVANDSIIKYLLKYKAHINAKDSFSLTPLHYAAMRGNDSAVRQLLLHSEINLEAKDRAHMTALHIAASRGSLQVCKSLLDAGCDMRSCDDNGIPALHFAAMEGHVDIAKLLVSHAEESDDVADIAKVVMDQDTALHLAVENGHFEMVNFFIQKGANVNFVRENMITLLHVACRYGQLDIVKLLVSSGSDIDAKDGSMANPLHTAALFNRLSVVEYLLDMGAMVNCCDKDKETPLMMASRRGYEDVVTFLLQRKADVTITDTKDRTCLYVAAEEGCDCVCKILLDNSVSKQMVEEFDKNDNTPLHVAVKKGHADVVQMLVNAGASVHAKNDSNLTPLHLASQYGRWRIVEILLGKNHTIVNDEDDSSNMPLHLAALEGHVKVVQILLKSGAAVDARNAMLWSPLDCAASRGWTKCAECLLNADSLIAPIDKVKVTPLHLASMAGHVAMIKLLISRKADITRTDHVGANCLDWAIDNKQRDSAMAILESEHWESALRSCTIEGNKILTPMRKMIKKLPEVAELVFDKCIIGNGLPKEHPSYEVTCNYEYLDDTFSDWGPSHEYISNINLQHQGLDLPTGTDKSMKNIQSLSKFKLPQVFSRKDEIRAEHPLRCMVQSGQTKLLSHRLIAYLLRDKWRTFGRYVYYAHLSVYLFYLMFITGFALTIIADDYYYNCIVDADNVTICECIKINNISYYPQPSHETRQIFEHFGRPVTIITAAILFSIEVMRLATDLHTNANFPCYLKILSYALSVIYVLCSYNYAEGSAMELWENWRCMYPHKSTGSVTVLIAWINLVLFIRVFPKLGIYVVMLTEITRTFFQCFPIVILFIIGFGLGFHILLHQQKPISYETPQRAIVKMLMGMLAEFEFDRIFNDQYDPVGTAWVLFIIYLIINCIIMMNLLVGLAVDDIKGVQEQAALKRIGMQVDHTLDVEKILPLSYRAKYVKMEESIVVNRENAWSFWSFWHSTSPKSSNMVTQMNNNIESVMKQQNNLREGIRALTQKVDNLEMSNNRKEAIMDLIIKQYNLGTL